MANVKITELTALTNPASTDVLPIVDVVADVTKKVSIADLLENAGSGTAAAPGIAFDGDSNTGIYRPGADQLALATNGTGRLFIDSSGNVGIGGTTSPGRLLEVSADAAQISIKSANDTTSELLFGDSADDNVGRLYYDHSDNSLGFWTSASEKARIDSSGRLLVGTSSALQIGSTDSAIQVRGTGPDDSGLSISRFSDSTAAGYLSIGKARGSIATPAIVNDDDTIGIIQFAAYDGGDLTTRAAEIVAEVDGTPGVDDMPGRLVFSVTADGSASPTEAMRIKNSRIINIANTPVYADNAAAKTGGLVDGDVYRTSTGDLKIVYT